MIEHIVLFKFKPGTSDADIEEILAAQRALKNQVEGVLDTAVGPDLTGRALGFTHGARMTLRDRDGLANFYPSPPHERFKEMLSSKLEQLLVFDFEDSSGIDRLGF